MRSRRGHFSFCFRLDQPERQDDRDYRADGHDQAQRVNRVDSVVRRLVDHQSRLLRIDQLCSAAAVRGQQRLACRPCG